MWPNTSSVSFYLLQLTFLRNLMRSFLNLYVELDISKNYIYKVTIKLKVYN